MASRNKSPDEHTKQIVESMSRLDEKMDQTKECLVKLAAEFSTHLQQDERFYDEVKQIAGSQLTIAEKLAEYNAQLKIHIAGVNELKEQTRIMREERELFRRDSETRLNSLENQNLMRERLEQESRERLGNRLKLLAGAVSFFSAVLAILKIFKSW